MIPEIEQPRPQGPTSPPAQIPQSAIRNPQSQDPSPARLRANRANAQKSTGPSSPEGKARSSQNARKHGLLARQVVLTEHGTEDPADFDELLTEIRDAYQPDGPCQHALVHRIAAYTWRLGRAQRFEVRAISTALDHGRAAARSQLADASAEYDRQISAARADLGEARAYLRCLTDDPDINPLDERLTFNLEPPVTEIARQYGRPLPEFVIAGNCVDDYGQFLFELGLKTREQVRAAFIAALQRLLPRCEELLAELETKRPETERASLLQSDNLSMDAVDGLGLLPGPDRLKLLIRYETMLNRERDRAVAELKALQSEPRGLPPRSSSCESPEPAPNEPIAVSSEVSDSSRTPDVEDPPRRGSPGPERDQPTEPPEAHPSGAPAQTTINPGLPIDAHRSLPPAAEFLAPTRADRLTEPAVRTQARRRSRSPQSASRDRTKPYDRQPLRRTVRHIYGTDFFPAKPEETRESDAPSSPADPISAPPPRSPSAAAGYSALKAKARQWRRPAPSLVPRIAFSSVKHRFTPAAFNPLKSNISKRTHLWGSVWQARGAGNHRRTFPHIRSPSKRFPGPFGPPRFRVSSSTLRTERVHVHPGSGGVGLSEWQSSAGVISCFPLV